MKIEYDNSLNIIAVKEASGSLEQCMEIINTKPSGFLVISGDDLLALPIVLAGGAGVISVIGQGFPQDFSDMVRYGLDNKVSEANTIQYKIIPVIDYIFAEGNPAGIKAVLNKIGLNKSSSHIYEKCCNNNNSQKKIKKLY